MSSGYRIEIPKGWDRTKDLKIWRLSTHIQISQSIGDFQDMHLCVPEHLIVSVPIQDAQLIPKFIEDWIKWSYT